MWAGVVGFNTLAITIAVIIRYCALGISEGYAEFIMWWLTLGVSGPLMMLGITYFSHKPEPPFSIKGVKIEKIKIGKIE